MCTGKCSRYIAVTLYPLALISVICNIVLFFPGGTVKYAKDGHITEEVKYMVGLGGGFMLLQLFLSIALAAAGVAGALYSFIVAVVGLNNGPLCEYGGMWTTSFKNSDTTYLAECKLWAKCKEPKHVVQFNMGLFLTLMATGCLQVLLCAIQMISRLFGCLCGVCINNEEP